MPTLGVEVKLSLANERTRNHLDGFYRGIKTNGIVLNPVVLLQPLDSRTFDTMESNLILFVSDSFDGTNPFDVLLTGDTLDKEGKYPSMNYESVGILIMDTHNIQSITITNTSEVQAQFRLIY